jgi:hypothetical protein
MKNGIFLLMFLILSLNCNKQTESDFIYNMIISDPLAQNCLKNQNWKTEFEESKIVYNLESSVIINYYSLLTKYEKLDYKIVSIHNSLNKYFIFSLNDYYYFSLTSDAFLTNWFDTIDSNLSFYIKEELRNKSTLENELNFFIKNEPEFNNLDNINSSNLKIWEFLDIIFEKILISKSVTNGDVNKIFESQNIAKKQIKDTNKLDLVFSDPSQIQDLIFDINKNIKYYFYYDSFYKIEIKRFNNDIKLNIDLLNKELFYILTF